MPREVDSPVYRQFKSSEKAIIDIGFYLNQVELLDVKSRQKLQELVLAFKNRLLSLPEISGAEMSGYLRPELQIKVKPDLLAKYELTMQQVKNQIISQNVRRPIGSLKDKRETEITIISELNSIDSLNEVIVTSGFQCQKLKLNDIANVEEAFEKTTTINKVQGHEGIIINVQKSEKTDILTAKEAVEKFLTTFLKNNQSSGIKAVLIDDESYDVKNRLELITSNGIVGFILILIVLFLFLDFRSGIWVAMGIPFSLSFTLIMAMVIGYTVNNMTLAAIIIVLGIVVDDAIIIAENITRNLKKSDDQNAVISVLDVGAPVVASVLTTCAAFIPLFFFSGRFGMFVKFIPVIIFLMLLASIFESFFLLPSHMVHETWLEKFFYRKFNFLNFTTFRDKFTEKAEKLYSEVILKILKHRGLTLLFFFILLVVAGFLFINKMNYVMFPREEARDFHVKVIAPEGTNRFEMASLVRKVEDIFLNDKHNVVTSVRTSIGQNRRGGEVKEHEASLRVEITPPSERNISLAKLISLWQLSFDNLDEFEEIKIQKSRFGSDSGSPIAIQIQENNDEKRKVIVDKLRERLEKLAILTNIEIERPVNKYEYKLNINKDKVSRLGIEYDQLALTLRSYVEGDVLYTLNNGEEEVDIRFTSLDDSKDDIKKILELTIANAENYLVPLSSLVEVKPNKKDANIQRVNYKRAAMIYADIAKTSNKTPLEIADIVEQQVFPDILKDNATTNLLFKGEVEDSRESQSDFSISIYLVIGLIYLLLIFLFDSFITPLLIGAIIPFGVIGTIFAFYFHGYEQYGFFAVVGTLGMIGVVINDSIVLIDKLIHSQFENSNVLNDISNISSTRLRAIVITTVTTVVGLFPTAYGIGGFDSMLSEMMFAMGWGLLFGMFITLVLVPCIYSFYYDFKRKIKGDKDV